MSCAAETRQSMAIISLAATTDILKRFPESLGYSPHHHLSSQIMTTVVLVIPRLCLSREWGEGGGGRRDERKKSVAECRAQIAVKGLLMFVARTLTLKM